MERTLVFRLMAELDRVSPIVEYTADETEPFVAFVKRHVEDRGVRYDSLAIEIPMPEGLLLAFIAEPEATFADVWTVVGHPNNEKIPSLGFGGYGGDGNGLFVQGVLESIQSAAQWLEAGVTIAAMVKASVIGARRLRYAQSRRLAREWVLTNAIPAELLGRVRQGGQTVKEASIEFGLGHAELGELFRACGMKLIFGGTGYWVTDDEAGVVTPLLADIRPNAEVGGGVTGN